MYILKWRRRCTKCRWTLFNEAKHFIDKCSATIVHGKQTRPTLKFGTKELKIKKNRLFENSHHENAFHRDDELLNATLCRVLYFCFYSFRFDIVLTAESDTRSLFFFLGNCGRRDALHDIVC